MKSKRITSTPSKIVIFGDTSGVQQLVRFIPSSHISAIVGASIRPFYNPDLARLCDDIGVPFLIQPKSDTPDYGTFVKEVSRLNPDVFIVNSYSMVLQPSILGVPKFGGLNIHMALLPRNRGANPIQWAIINGENYTGVTLHEISEDIDAGPIVDQKRIRIFFSDTWIDVRAGLDQVTDELIQSNLQSILSCSWSATNQVENYATYNKRRKPTDSEISWNTPIVKIYRLINALIPPMPSAFVKNSDGAIKQFSEKINLNNLICLKLEELGGGKLIGQKILLRPVKRDDSELLYKWINDKDLVHFNSPFKPVSEIQHDEWLGKVLDERNDLIIFVIAEKDTHKVIGSCQLFNINWIHRSAELQIRIGDPNYFGRGFGVEAVEILCKFGFTELNLNRIYLNVFESNTRAIRAYEKAGFKLEGVMQEAAHIDGQFVNIHIMALLRNKLIGPVGM